MQKLICAIAAAAMMTFVVGCGDTKKVENKEHIESHTVNTGHGTAEVEHKTTETTTVTTPENAPAETPAPANP